MSVTLLGSTREAWQSAQSAYERFLSSTEKNGSRLAFLEEGESTGHLLARIANSHQRSPAIGTIRSQTGRLVHSPDLVL